MKPPRRSAPFAKRSLGQNFLTDPNYIQKIIEAVDPKPKDVVIEIGPGRGALTEQLVDSGAKVIAIELDHELSLSLSDRFGDIDDAQVIERDVLEVNFSHLSERDDLKLVGNLPYYISTAILQRLAKQRSVFLDVVLMFQKEVVDRITAEPGDSARGYLSVIVQAAFEVEKLFEVPPSAFRPVPKVRSSVVRLKPKPASPFDDETFRRMAGIAFAQKRKTILNNLKGNYPNGASALAAAGVDPSRRAETLSLAEWTDLYRALAGLSA